MKNFRCLRCGSCCRGESTVSLTETEVSRISAFLNLPKEDFLKTYTTEVCRGRVEMKTVEGFCIFFDRTEHICKIHPVKPNRCKEWPFPQAIFSDEDNFRIIRDSCPALESFSFEDIKVLKNLTK